MRIAVLGAGAWGTAIGVALSARHEVALWARDASQAQAIAKARRNSRYLPDVELPATLEVTADLGKAVVGAALLLAATPVAGLRELLGKIDKRAPLVWLCQGFEEGS